MKNEITLRQQIEAYQKDKSFPGDMAHCYNFYDWFCSAEALEGRAHKLMPKVIKFAKKMNLDLDKYYVFFKNNCPMSGSLYDDFRICDIETGDVIYNVTPASGHSGMAEVYSNKNGFANPLFEAETWSSLYQKLIPDGWRMPVSTI